ncbi:unnamed protein product [Linum trigynum]|uniref:Uncharacterized protein n=1 Tax=Linum trigynum TaxID=586398 RepID=A0AAV2GBD3_9ROSI
MGLKHARVDPSTAHCPCTMVTMKKTNVAKDGITQYNPPCKGSLKTPLLSGQGQARSNPTWSCHTSAGWEQVCHEWWT